MGTPDPLSDIRRIAADLRIVLDEIEHWSGKVGNRQVPNSETGQLELVLGSEGRWRKKYNAAYAYAKTHGGRGSEGDRKQYAESQSFDEWAQYNADQTALKVARERAHSLRQILSSFQTAARVEADLSR